MGLIEYLFNRPPVDPNKEWEDFFATYGKHLDLINVYKNSAIDRITDMLSMMEFESYVKGERQYTYNQYVWNVSPNRHQTKSEFVKELYTKLLTQGEVLIVQVNDEFLIADSFVMEERALVDDIFKNVDVRGYTLKDVFTISQVIYLRRDDNSLRDLNKHMDDFIDPLLGNIKDTYIRNRAKKYILYQNTIMNSQQKRVDKDGKEIVPAYIRNISNLIKAEADSVTTLPKGMELESIEPESRYENDRSGIENIIKLHDLKKSLSILPFGLTDDVLNHEKRVLPYFINSVLYPLAQLLEDAINRSSMYGLNAYLEQTYMKINLDRLFYEEAKDKMATIEVKVRSGVYSINDARKEMGLAVLPDEWAEYHFMTKNNATVQGIIQEENDKEVQRIVKGTSDNE